MARAEVREGGLEELVTKPMPRQITTGVVIRSVPVIKQQVAIMLGGSGASAGAPLAGYRIMAVPGGDYFAWVVRQGWAGKADIFYSDNYGGVGGFVSGIIKADIDKVALYEQSPTLKSMAEALKKALWGYEFAMTFPIVKLPFDAILAALAYKNMRIGAIERDTWEPYFKANVAAAGVDGGLFVGTYIIKEIMLGKVTEIIRYPAGTYSSKEAAIEAVKNMIFNQYFPFVNGIMKIVGYGLAVGVPVASVLIHVYLLHRADKKSKAFVEEIIKGRPKVIPG